MLHLNCLLKEWGDIHCPWQRLKFTFQSFELTSSYSRPWILESPIQVNPTQICKHKFQFIFPLKPLPLKFLGNKSKLIFMQTIFNIENYSKVIVCRKSSQGHLELRYLHPINLQFLGEGKRIKTVRNFADTQTHIFVELSEWLVFFFLLFGGHF